MPSIETLLHLQEEYRRVGREYLSLTQEYQELDARYGGGNDGRRTRFEEINRELSKTYHHAAGAHSEEDFDSRHNLREEGGQRYWSSVQGCPSCDRLYESTGRSALLGERERLLAWAKELQTLYERRSGLREQAKEVVSKINQEAARIGLPGFEAQFNGEGFAYTRRLTRFRHGGEVLLESGTVVSYGTMTVVFDSSENMIAYKSGDGGWMLMHEPAKPRIDTPRGWYSVLREAGTIEIMIDRHGQFTNTYPHVHVIHDERGNQIRVVASRSSTDHSPAETLPGDASGNEVNAAIERAIRLL